MNIVLIILISLCIIVFVLLMGLYYVYSRNVNMNEDISEMNTKLTDIIKNTEEANETSALKFNTINNKIDDNIQQNISALESDLDEYETKISNMKESHSNINLMMNSNIDSVIVDLNTIENNMLDHQTSYSESLSDIEQAFLNTRTEINQYINTLKSADADLDRRFVEYKVSSDDSYDALEASFTELDEEMDEQNNLYVTLQQKYTELDEKMDNLQMSNEEQTEEQIEDKINVYALDFDPKKYPLVNHYKSDYIVFSGIDKFSERNSWEQWFRSEPKDYLIHDRGHQMTHIHLFEAKNGITYQGDFKRYLILSDKFVKMGNKMFYEDTEKNLQEIPSDKRIRSLQSLYVPPFMDIILTDDDTDDTISLRELYPTQLFISYTTGLELESQVDNSSDGNKFFNFYNERNNVTINSHQLTDPENIKSAVGSVFLRYRYAPFSVFEFQKNEVVYWHDLMKIGIGNNNFVTNNGVAIDTSKTPVIYIPIGAGIKILALHNVKVYEVTHDRSRFDKRKYDREIPLITCMDSEDEFYNEYYNSKKLCFFSGENPIIARKINMTIKLELVVNGNKQSTYYTFDEPIFKVL